MEVRIVLPNQIKFDTEKQEENAMEIEEEEDPSAWFHLVTPGETIKDDPQFMKGHGAYLENDSTLVANVQGVVERVNKLISVRPMRTRYSGDIGDVVVGRITEVGQKRWKVDLHARQDAVLQLSSIHLPGGIQRRKSESDELAMRHYFAEGDILIAEVHQHHEMGLGLHTRSTKYGKREKGVLVTVPHDLIPRMKSHFLTLMKVEIVLGMNGWVWMESDHLETLSRLFVCFHICALHRTLLSEAKLLALYKASLNYPTQVLVQADIMRKIYNEGKIDYER